MGLGHLKVYRPGSGHIFSRNNLRQGEEICYGQTGKCSDTVRPGGGEAGVLPHGPGRRLFQIPSFGAPPLRNGGHAEHLSEPREALEIADLPFLRVTGQVRSWNNHSGVGPRLVITVLARELAFTGDDFENTVTLTGTLCKEPTLRRTPMGREISDMMLSVERRYGKSDYIPCIAWGAVARRAAGWAKGAAVTVTGRLQSRAYIKMEGEEATQKVAYEISAVSAEEIDPEEWAAR